MATDSLRKDAVSCGFQTTIISIPMQKNGQEAAVVECPAQLQSIANLLSGPAGKYGTSLTHKITVGLVCIATTVACIYGQILHKATE